MLLSFDGVACHLSLRLIAQAAGDKQLSVREILTLVISSTVLFTSLGGGIGFFLGRFFPSYYIAVFRTGNEASFDPLAVGIGQGITQGISAGTIVGVLLVVVLAWYRAKTFTPKERVE